MASGWCCEHRLLGADDAVALLVLLGLVDGRRVLGDRAPGSPGGSYSHAFIQPAVRGHAADRDELPGAAAQQRRRCMRSRPYIAYGDVERARRRARRASASSSYGSAWRCSTAGGRLGALVGAAVEDRDRVAAVDEALHERDPGRPGAADHQHVHDAGSYYAPGE